MHLEKLENLMKDVSLAEHNTYKVGGKARMFVEVSNKEDLKKVIYLANLSRVPYKVFGGGTNILVSDSGFDGIIIKNKIQDFRLDMEDKVLFAESGAPMGVLVNQAMKKGLSGLEWAAGLPGTLGGAIFGNAGSCGSCISDNIEFIEVFDPLTLQIKHIMNEDSGFGYRDSGFKKSGYIILGAALKLKEGDTVEIMEKMVENMSFRKNHQPLSGKSEGCVFKNINLDDNNNAPSQLWKNLPEAASFVMKGIIPAGFLIDKAGLKGLKNGGAKVSERHANFIVNEDNAKAEDIFNLIEEIKKRVFEKYGITLEEEINIIGFN